MKKNIFKLSFFGLALLINAMVYMVFFYELEPVDVGCEHAIVDFSIKDLSEFQVDISNLKNIPKNFEDAIITASIFIQNSKM
jgi:hypothetical protein